MKLKYGSLTIAVLLLAACSEAPVSQEQQFIDDVAAALGGKANIESMNTVAVEGEGYMQNVGQDMTPESTELRFAISDYSFRADLNTGSSRTEQTRTPEFEYFRGPDPITQVFGIDGDVAYTVAPDGSARRAPQTVATAQRSTFYHHPVPLLRATLLGSATVGNVRSEDGLVLADFTTSEGNTLTMAVDSSTNLPTYIRSTVHHDYLRDVTRTTSFSDYAATGEMTAPTTLSIDLDEFHLISLRLTSQIPNADVGDLSAPPDAVATAPSTGPAPANVTAEAVADGVWFLAGQSHHSVLIEFSDHLMVVEAPNEVRALAVEAKAAELVPDKPIRYLVNTHHHFDHSGGIRTAVSQGQTIVTQAANEAFYRRMADQPSTIVPDAQSGQQQAISIEVVEDARTYADDSMTVELYHVADNPHSSSMLMAYLPVQKLIIEADAFTPNPSRPQKYSPNLLANIQRLELEIERIVPIHGAIGDFAELEAHVQELGGE